MNIKKCRFFFFLFCYTLTQVNYGAPKILVTRYENWSHPIRVILKKYDILLYKVHYSKDGSCPTFYTTSKLPNWKNNTTKTIYSDLMKANFNFPYALVNKDKDVKINVGWENKSKKILSIDVTKSSVRSICKGNAHANIDEGEDFEKFEITEELKKKIMNSPYKAHLTRDDGRKFEAYLFAVQVKNDKYRHYSCKSKTSKDVESKIGHFYIYLYDISKGEFIHKRIEIFQHINKTIMGLPGANFFSLNLGIKKSLDVLFVSQERGCYDDDYEAYGFSQHHDFLKKFSFVTEENKSLFSGVIYKKKDNNKVIAKHDSTDKEKLYMSAFSTGIIKLNRENK